MTYKHHRSRTSGNIRDFNCDLQQLLSSPREKKIDISADGKKPMDVNTRINLVHPCYAGATATFLCVTTLTANENGVLRFFKTIAQLNSLYVSEVEGESHGDVGQMKGGG